MTSMNAGDKKTNGSRQFYIKPARHCDDCQTVMDWRTANPQHKVYRPTEILICNPAGKRRHASHLSDAFTGGARW